MVSGFGRGVLPTVPRLLLGSSGRRPSISLLPLLMRGTAQPVTAFGVNPSGSIGGVWEREQEPTAIVRKRTCDGTSETRDRSRRRLRSPTLARLREAPLKQLPH